MLLCMPHFSNGFIKITHNLSKESETVFTTCIYNNIWHGHKMPHSIDTNS